MSERGSTVQFGMEPDRLGSPDPLREFLRERLSLEQTRYMASRDYDQDTEALGAAFKRSLETGTFSYDGMGSPFEVAMLQHYSRAKDRPLFQLFGAWWIGSFCTEVESDFGFIENLGMHGIDVFLGWIADACAGLGHDASLAAMASIPFVRYVQSRLVRAGLNVDYYCFPSAIKVLKEVERLGATAAQTDEHRFFLSYCERMTRE